MSAMTKINDTYYFRLRVPKDVKEYFPRPVIVKSTHTKKYIHAKSLVRVMLGKLEDVFMTIRSKVLDDAAIYKIVQEFVESTLEQNYDTIDDVMSHPDNQEVLTELLVHEEAAIVPMNEL
jgi:hypothetical protein